jgi:hypothetical protein
MKTNMRNSLITILIRGNKMMEGRFNKKLLAIVAVMMLMPLLSTVFVTSPAAAAAEKNLDAGSTWVIDKVTDLTRLEIAAGAIVKAPEGYSITMTVNGVEMPISAGTYAGKVVLTPTKNIPIKYSGSGINETYSLRTGIYVNNGAYISDKSVAAAVVGGTVTDDSARGVKITSVGENFNGIIVAGDSKFSYSIINPEIKLNGNGGNDFAGYGAALMSDGKAEVTVENAKIINKGCIRGAVWVGGDSIAKINNSDIEVQNGTLPKVSTTPTFMMEVPWMLGLSGNNRATLVVGNGTAYYNNTHVKAQGWGVLSTDAVQNVKLYAVKSHVETVESGYGAYADGTSLDSFSGCKFDVNDYGLIMTGGDGVFTDETVVNSDRFGVMIHSGGKGTLTIDKGSVFNTKETVIQVKTAYPTIVADSAKLNSKSGVILQAMMNDDPYAGGGGSGPGSETGGARAGGDRGNAPGRASDGSAGGPRGGQGEQSRIGGAPSRGMPGGGSHKDVAATFKNMVLDGDIINSMTTLSDVVVNFEKAAITGAITTATSVFVSKTFTKENWKAIGQVANTYCATNEKHGMKVSLDGKSQWVVNKTSYITGLTIAEGAAVTAPQGYKVTMTVDDAVKEITPGEYKGKIVLTVTKIF